MSNQKESSNMGMQHASFDDYEKNLEEAKKWETVDQVLIAKVMQTAYSILEKDLREKRGERGRFIVHPGTAEQMEIDVIAPDESCNDSSRGLIDVWQPAYYRNYERKFRRLAGYTLYERAITNCLVGFGNWDEFLKVTNDEIQILLLNLEIILSDVPKYAGYFQKQKNDD